MTPRRSGFRRQGVRITKVGLWFALLAVIVGIAATNTGNNALYLVVASMTGLLAACWLVARVNGWGIDIVVDVPGEVFGDAPALAAISIRHRGRWLKRRELVFRIAGQEPLIVHCLAPGGRFQGHCRMAFQRRGWQPLPASETVSLFPLGLFRCERRAPSLGEVLVFPKLLAQPTIRYRKPGELGADSTHRPGWGHDLHALRPFRPGDDPRSIHWKQSARIGDLVFKEHEAEESRRLAIVLDEGILDPDADGTAELAPAVALEFEHLVREAATAGVDYLRRGFEVELVTRGCQIPFATGPRQRFELLECLALIEPCASAKGRLDSSDSTTPSLRLVIGQDLGQGGRGPSGDDGRAQRELRDRLRRATG